MTDPTDAEFIENLANELVEALDTIPPRFPNSRRKTARLQIEDAFNAGRAAATATPDRGAVIEAMFNVRSPSTPGLVIFMDEPEDRRDVEALADAVIAALVTPTESNPTPKGKDQ